MIEKTERWHFLDTGPADAAWNMACDDVLLRNTGIRDQGLWIGGTTSDPQLPTPNPQPLLRLYSWLHPAVSLGYFQKWSPALVDGRELVRRPTGGGLVEHGDGFTYSVILPKLHPLAELPTREIYREIHEAVREALAAMGVAAALTALDGRRTPCAPTRQRSKETAPCFIAPTCYDLVADGRKIAGAAIRKSRDGVLIQGEVKMRELGLQKAFAEAFGARFVEITQGENLKSEITKLAREKYATEAWRKRFL